MLTLRQEKFIIEYIKTNNATKAAGIAGYKGRQLRKYASALLAKPDIARRIEEVRSQIDTQGIADSTEIQRELTTILRDKVNNERGIPIITPRIQAAAELNRMRGLTDKGITINYAQILNVLDSLEGLTPEEVERKLNAPE